MCGATCVQVHLCVGILVCGATCVWVHLCGRPPVGGPPVGGHLCVGPPVCGATCGGPPVCGVSGTGHNPVRHMAGCVPEASLSSYEVQ